MQIDVTPEYLASQGLSPTFEDRFWEKVFIMTDGRGCWLWTASCHGLGYGQIGRWKEKDPPIRAHRASWILNYGPIPDGLFVCHKCDNPVCVRPDHLFLGTEKENTQDMMSKGRHVIGIRHFGERSGVCKLSDMKVEQIRSLRSTGMSQQSIANKIGTSQTNVSAILRGLTRRRPTYPQTNP